jgi:hypothetical protein
VPAEQRLLRANGRLQRTVNARLRAQRAEQRQKAHRTVNRTCPVHHRTVRWSHSSDLRRSNPNGLVTWLAHQTVRCAMRQKPSPTAILVVGGYKYPPTTTLQDIQAFTTLHSIQEQYTTLQDINQSLRPNQSPQFNSRFLGLVRRSDCVLLLFLLLGWLSSPPISSSITLVIKARDTKLWWSL